MPELLDRELLVYSGMGYSGSLSDQRRAFWIAQLHLELTGKFYSNSDLESMYLHQKVGSVGDKLSVSNMRELLGIPDGFSNIDGTGTAIVLEVTNVAVNGVPTSNSITWNSIDVVNIPISFVAGEIQSTHTIARADSQLVSIYRAGVITILDSTGKQWQRSIEVKPSVDAHVINSASPGGYRAGQALPANVWTRVVQTFTGNDLPAQFLMALTIVADVSVVGVEVLTYLRKSMLVEAPPDRILAYCDGNSPGWHWNGTPGNSTSSGPPIYIGDDPIANGPIAEHVIWAGDPNWVTGKPADGGVVTQIRNAGSVGGDLISTGAPIYHASDPAMSNKASIEFDVSSFATLNPMVIAQPYWIIAILKIKVIDAVNRMMVVTDTNFAGILRANLNIGLYADNSGAIGLSSVGVGSTNSALIIAKVDNVNSSLLVNTTLVSGTVASAASTVFFGIGGNAARKSPETITYAAITTTDPTSDPVKYQALKDFARSCGVAV